MKSKTVHNHCDTVTRGFAWRSRIILYCCLAFLCLSSNAAFAAQNVTSGSFTVYRGNSGAFTNMAGAGFSVSGDTYHPGDGLWGLCDVCRPGDNLDVSGSMFGQDFFGGPATIGSQYYPSVSWGSLFAGGPSYFGITGGPAIHLTGPGTYTTSFTFIGALCGVAPTHYYVCDVNLPAMYGVGTATVSVFVDGIGNLEVAWTRYDFTTSSCTTAPSNMVAWYSFDQSGASQKDLAQYNTATAYGTTSIAGEVSSALQFNGANAYVEAPAQPWNNLGTGNFSINAWVKIANPADYNGVVAILDKRDASHGYHLFLYNGQLGLQLADSSGYANYISNTVVPADNQWHLITVTVNRTYVKGGVWYLDGFGAGTFNPTAHAGSLNSTAPLDIGSRSALQGGYGFFRGGIDELQIFARVLSSTEIVSLMQAGPAGNCKCVAPPSNMVAWYGFDQTGSTQNDLTTYANTATASSTASSTGEVANALQFNGAGAYVQAPAQSWINMGTNDFSIDAWVKVANAADYTGVVAILDKRDPYPSRGYHFFLYNGRIGLQLADNLGYANYISTTAVPADNKWHLIAVTVKRTVPTGGVWYLDGVPIDTPFNPTGHPNSINSSEPLFIGALAGGNGSFFKGGLDELEIFNRSLSSPELQSIAKAGPAGTCKN